MTIKKIPMTSIKTVKKKRESRESRSARGYDDFHFEQRRALIAERIFCEFVDGDGTRCIECTGLQLHHKDGNPFNKRTENLEILCTTHHREADSLRRQAGQ